jgi:DNA-directed RNA polymerase beta subunit
MPKIAASKVNESDSFEECKPAVLNEQHMWGLIDLHFKDRRITQHQIDSYNRFIHDIATVIHRYGEFEVRVVPQFEPDMEVVP